LVAASVQPGARSASHRAPGLFEPAAEFSVLGSQAGDLVVGGGEPRLKGPFGCAFGGRPAGRTGPVFVAEPAHLGE
jgi:hypothetical protein